MNINSINKKIQWFLHTTVDTWQKKKFLKQWRLDKRQTIYQELKTSSNSFLYKYMRYMMVFKEEMQRG